MAASATATSRHRATPLVVVQPPTHVLGADGNPIPLAGLSDDALYEALTGDREQWDSERCAAESGRHIGRFRVWVSNFYRTADDKRKVPDDRTFIKPVDYHGRSPWWYAGDVRQWFIQNGIMDRRGVFIPFKPTGRPKGAVDRLPRQRRRATMRDTAPDVLKQYDTLLARGMADSDAREQLATELGLSRRQVARRINTARQLAAPPSTPTAAAAA